MRTDLKYRFMLALIIALIPLVLGLVITFFMLNLPLGIRILPLVLFAAAFLITFILGFVPFMKDHMWLSVLSVTVLAALTGLIIHLVV